MAKIGGVTAPSPSGQAPGEAFRPSAGTERPWRKIPIVGPLISGSGVIRFVHNTGVDPAGGPAQTNGIRVLDAATGLVILNLGMNPGDTALVYIPFSDGIVIPDTWGAPQCIISGD